MCYPVECSRCHKTTWGGCGEHVGHVRRLISGETEDIECVRHDRRGFWQRNARRSRKCRRAISGTVQHVFGRDTGFAEFFDGAGRFRCGERGISTELEGFGS